MITNIPPMIAHQLLKYILPFFIVAGIIVSVTAQGANNSELNSLTACNEFSSSERQDVNTKDGKPDGVAFFIGNWQKVTKDFVDLELPIFVFVYANYKSDCQKMQRNVFEQKAVGEFFNRNFLSVKINLQTEDGFKFNNDYSLRDYPSYLFFHPNGELVYQSSGHMDAESFLALSSKALSLCQTKAKILKVAVSHEGEMEFNVADKYDNLYKKLIESNVKYGNGYYNPDFLYEYAYLLKKFNVPYQHVANQYLDVLPKNELSSTKNVAFVCDFADNIQSAAFNLLIKNLNYYSVIADEELVNKRIKEAVKMSVILAAANRNTKELEQAISVIKSANLPDVEEFEFLMRTTYFEKLERWQEFSTLAIAYFKDGNGADPNMLNVFSRKFAVYISNELKLEKALVWAKTLVNDKPSNFKYRETYSALLYRLDKTSKSLKEAEVAKALAQKKGLDYSSTLYLMESIRTQKKLSPTIIEE